MIEFPFPDPDARKKIWRHSLPEKARLQRDVDLDFYADRFDLSGSEIREALLSAAFLATAEGKAIGRKHIEKALTQCFAKYGRVLTSKDFW